MTKSKFPHLFPPLEMIKSNFLSFFRHKKWQSSNFRTFSDLKNGKVQISKLFPNISELFHSEFRTLFGISCYGRLLLNILKRLWTFLLNISCNISLINYILKLNYNKYIISFLIKFDIFIISIFLLKSIYFISFSLDFN